MENFVKTSCELVSGNVVIKSNLIARSLVLVNVNTNSVYNITAKCRNTDKMSICKALAKAVLVAKREALKMNSTDAAMESKKRVTNPMSSALSAHKVMVTDKDGKILQDSGISLVGDKESDKAKLSTVFRFSQGLPIYKLVVEQGLDWSEESVVKALNAWCTAAIEQLDYTKNLDAQLENAANSTENEQKETEKIEATEQAA